jgi:Family of unknown function (DUF6325)
MSLGPIELVVIGFESTPSSGHISAAVQDLVDREVITLVDGLLIAKGDDDLITYAEIEQVDADESIKALGDLLDPEGDGLLTDEDVDQIADQMPAGTSALMLVFENTWVKPVRDAIQDAGGFLMAQVRIPGAVVDEVLADVAASR